MGRRKTDPFTTGTANTLGLPWLWRCGRDHDQTTPDGVTLHRCLHGGCTSRTVHRVTPAGNPKK